MRYGLLPALGLLLLQGISGAFSGASQTKPTGEVTGFVLPTQVGSNEPFTFAVTGVVEGEVVTIKTVDGEVVATKKADKLGRVFLAGGLAAGAYLLTAGSESHGRSQLEVRQQVQTGGGSMSIHDLPKCVDVQQGLSLTGEGMNPDASAMSVKIGETEFPVLAGTATEMKTGPLPNSVCGVGPIEVKNNQTGETSRLDNVVCYELAAQLSKRTLAGGEQTTLEFNFKPADFNANATARILSGPVTFEGGAQEKSFQIVNGIGNLPLLANPAGNGPFRVSYEIGEILGTGALAGHTYIAKNPKGEGGEKPDSKTEKKKRCPLTKHIRDEATGWESSEKTVKDPETGKEKTVYIISRTIRCSVHKSCSKEEGHGGECAFTGKHRCKEHDTTETREYDSERARKDGMKDTAIPPDLRDPK